MVTLFKTPPGNIFGRHILGIAFSARLVTRTHFIFSIDAAFVSNTFRLASATNNDVALLLPRHLAKIRRPRRLAAPWVALLKRLHSSFYYFLNLPRKSNANIS